MPEIQTLELRPITIFDSNPSSPTFAIVGGDTALSDDSDATYIQSLNLDQTSTLSVQFAGVSLPEGALADFYIHARYQQVSGTSAGLPVLEWQISPALRMSARVLVGSVDGVHEEDGYWANGSTAPAYGDFSSLFPRDPITPSTWNVTFAHTAFAVCDFRVYELTWHIAYYVPGKATAPLRRQYPNDRRRLYPAPTSNQEGNRLTGYW